MLKKTCIASFACAILASGCSSATKPNAVVSSTSATSLNPENSRFVTDFDPGRVPSDIIEMGTEGISFGSDLDNLEVKAVQDAGRRLGATAGYNNQAEALYSEIESYDVYLSKIFDFQTLLLPEGVIPPVLAQTDRVIQHESQTNKTIRARVYKTQKQAAFVNPRPPSWRNYLQLPRIEIDRPLPQLSETINDHKRAWELAVQEGWARGHEQARQDFEIAINELERDYLGMQLFHMLWLAEMVEAPKVVNRSSNIEGGGPGSNEMSVGVNQFIITEDAYFINDSSEWNAVITEATSSMSEAKAGLNDLVERSDNTDAIPSPILDNDLSGRY